MTSPIPKSVTPASPVDQSLLYPRHTKNSGKPSPATKAR